MFLIKEIQFLKEYIFSLGKFILIAFLIFVSTTIISFFYVQKLPTGEIEIILKELQEITESIIKMPPFTQFLIIFLNNSLKTFLVIILGVIFGIFPFLFLFSNGLILGVTIYFAQTQIDWLTIFLLIFPHGIIEIPVIILASAIGLKLGKISFDKIFRKIKISIKAELIIAFKIFFKFLFPFLVLAAFIEIFVVSNFVKP